MRTTLKRLGSAYLAACGLAATAAGQYYYDVSAAGSACPCRRPYVSHPGMQFSTHSRPSTVAGHSATHAPTQRLPSRYYTPEDAQVLYHPVVVPLEEFLSPRRPIALTPAQVARQKAAAEARATAAQSPQAATPPANDPFTDDAPPATPLQRTGAPASEPPDENPFQ